MTLKSAKPSSINHSRCRHFTANGARCRLPVLDTTSHLCFRHSSLGAAASQLSPNDSEDLSADLLPELSEFSSGDDIRKFLARLLVLVTKGRISPRRASVLGYITNQLLHSHRAVRQEQPVIIEEITSVEPGDIPRPGDSWRTKLYPADDSRPARERVPCYWTIPLPDDASVPSPAGGPPAANPGTNSHPEKPPS